MFARTNNYIKGNKKEDDHTKIWVLGFYQRDTKQARAFVVENRNKITLTSTIRENVIEGTTIYTDFWGGYNDLSEYYFHKPVNKSRQFTSKIGDSWTNQVESLWAVLKRDINRYSCFKKESIQMFIDEALWRRKFKSFNDRIFSLINLFKIKKIS